MLMNSVIVCSYDTDWLWIYWRTPCRYKVLRGVRSYRGIDKQPWDSKYVASLFLHDTQICNLIDVIVGIDGTTQTPQ